MWPDVDHLALDGHHGPALGLAIQFESRRPSPVVGPDPSPRPLSHLSSLAASQHDNVVHPAAHFHVRAGRHNPSFVLAVPPGGQLDYTHMVAVEGLGIPVRLAITP